MPTKPEIKAQYSGGEMMPAFGTPEYAKAQALVKPPAKTTNDTVVTNPTTPKRTPGLLETYKEEQARIANDRTSALRQAESEAASIRQRRIDAINQTFAPRFEREAKEGEGRLSRVAALNFRSGIVGSGVDTTRVGEQKGENEKAMRALEGERSLMIQDVLKSVDQLTKERAALLTEQAREGAEANVKYAKEKVDVALNALNTFASAGNVTSAKDLMSVDQDSYDTLREVSGMSDSEIDAYLKTHAAEGTYQWNASQISGSKMLVPKIVDGKVTMESLDLGPDYKADKQVQTTVKTDDGVYIIYKDGTTTLIGGKKEDNNLKAGAPTWEEYLAAAENVAQMNFSNETRAELRKQYDKAYVIADTSDYTSTEKKKLEQAGLLNSTRQEQLDYLYGGDDTGDINFGE